MSAAEERELVLRAQRGDVEAFGELVRRYQSAVYNVAYRLFGSRRDAEDAAQEAFLRAFHAFDAFDPERPLAPWLKRIVANVSLNWLQLAESKRTQAAVDMHRPGQEAVTMDDWAATRPLPEQSLIAQETAGRVRAAILRLPPHYRVVIELRHFQDLSYEEIAAELDRSLNNVKSDLFRARKLLAGYLEEK